jgi:putative transposase
MTYEYKLIPTPEQAATIERNLDVCRKVWNYALRERKDWVLSRKSPVNACSQECEYIIRADEPFPNYHVQAKRLTDAKKTHPELAEVHYQVLQQTLRTLDRAWDDMKGRGFGFPRFKNRYRMRYFVFPQVGKDPIKNESIKLPQLGCIRWHYSRPVPNGFEVKQARIVRKASGYFVCLSLQMDVSVPDVPFHGHPIDIDLGLDKFLATSEGELVDRLRFLKTLYRKLKSLQRRLKNQQKGSNNRHKLHRKIARVHQKIADTRHDWHFKLAHHLTRDAGAIFVEEINFRSWGRGMLAKHCLDAGFGQFVNILTWVCWKNDVYFGAVDKNGTSQTCPNCGTHTGKKTLDILDIRVHHCPSCGYTTHRDVAAAQVIRNRGISAVGHTVVENVCGDDTAGVVRQDGLVGSLRSRKPKS